MINTPTGARRPKKGDMRKIYTWTMVLTLSMTAIPALALAQDPPPPTWQLDGSFSFRRFEQQFKPEVGGLAGERLVEESELSLALTGSWQILDFLAVGAYLRFDQGAREAGRFDGFDSEGRTQVNPLVGGAFNELWIGPLVRGSWKWFFLELGYGAYGRRDDEARGDLSTEKDDTTTPLRTLPSVAYLANLGAKIPLSAQLDLVLRLEYRVRYYDRRGDDPLATPAGDPVIHGTQNYTPFVGLSWRGQGPEKPKTP